MERAIRIRQSMRLISIRHSNSVYVKTPHKCCSLLIRSFSNTAENATSTASLGGSKTSKKDNILEKGSFPPPKIENPIPSFNTGEAADSPQLEPQVDDLGRDHSFVGLTGGQIFHEMMLRHGVKHIFGYPGGAILPTFDAIYNSPHFEFILPRHEQGAGHMAEGYARATGRCGVVIVTSGPGATNMITPIADAYADGTPLVVFSGQVPTNAIGTDAFQEADVVGISRMCTKWNVMIRDVAELPRRINEAFEIAMQGRPGPVLVDFPKDVQASVLRRPIATNTSLPKAVLPTDSEFDDIDLEAALDDCANLIAKAKQPVIYVGQGILSSPEGPLMLRALSEKLSIPVTTTLQALGSFDEHDPKALHMIGMHGSGYANLAIQNADLIIGLGGRFDDRVTGNIASFAANARKAADEGRGGIIHFEIMPKNINKVVQATQAIEGDVVENLIKLLPRLKPVSMQERSDWFKQISEWKSKYPFKFKPSKSGEALKPQEVIQELSKQCEPFKDKVVITTGVGQHQMFAAQHFRWRFPRTMITSGGLGTMGYGLPAAIGAQVALPHQIVINIDGDASFCMTAMEMATAAQHNIPVKILLINNEEQGMVTQWQSLFYEKRYSHTHHKNPDFMALAESMRVKALKVYDIEDLPSKMKTFLEYRDGPILLEAFVSPKEHVLPMVPAGKGLHQFISS